jgi:protein-tyrosine phosphatase
VVFVCTGNRFRSPLAEHLLRRLAEGLPVRTTSRGTLKLGPVPALPLAVEAGRRFGVDLSAHHATSLEGENLSWADLVLGFERMHVVTAVVDADARREGTFTLPELVGLLEQASYPAETGMARARAALDAAAELRSLDARRALPEVDDPIGRPAAVAAEIAEQVRGLTERLAAQLFGV